VKLHAVPGAAPPHLRRMPFRSLYLYVNKLGLPLPQLPIRCAPLLWWVPQHCHNALRPRLYTSPVPGFSLSFPDFFSGTPLSSPVDHRWDFSPPSLFLGLPVAKPPLSRPAAIRFLRLICASFVTPVRSVLRPFSPGSRPPGHGPGSCGHTPQHFLHICGPYLCSDC